MASVLRGPYPAASRRNKPKLLTGSVSNCCHNGRETGSGETSALGEQGADKSQLARAEFAVSDRNAVGLMPSVKPDHEYTLRRKAAMEPHLTAQGVILDRSLLRLFAAANFQWRSVRYLDVHKTDEPTLR